MPEVYYEVNRPDLNALYVNQLIQRDFSRQGSTDDWVKYLTTSKPHLPGQPSTILGLSLNSRRKA